MTTDTNIIDSINNTVFIDTQSEPGSWEQALQFSQHIKVLDSKKVRRT